MSKYYIGDIIEEEREVSDKLRHMKDKVTNLFGSYLKLIKTFYD